MPIHSRSDSTTTTLTINVTVTSIYNDNTVTFDILFYVLAGLGGAILILMFCIIIMCIRFCLHILTVPLGRKKRQMFTFTADNVEDNEHSWQQSGK